MKGIILHGGHGTRLRPLTHTGPKQLLPIGNKPMSQYCIESLKEAKLRKLQLLWEELVLIKFENIMVMEKD